MLIPEEYKTAVEACPTPLMLVSHDGEIVSTNKRLDSLFGHETGALLGQSVEVLVPEPIREAHPELRQAFAEVPTSRSMGTGRDLYGVRKDGEMIPVEIGLDPVASGEFNAVMVSVIDIRERKQGETKIRRALDAASSGMVMIDEDGKIELVNRQACRMFSYEPGELIGQSVEVLVPERFRRRHTVYRVSYQNTRDSRPMGAGRDLFGLTKDGKEVPIEIGLTPIDGPDGRLIMATVIDITERKQNERTTRRKNEELQRLNVELSEFAYSASHDLKSPLVSISGLLAYCQSDLSSGNLEEVQANLDRAEGLATRLAMRIEDMLKLAKSGNIDDKWEDLVVEDMVEDVWQGLSDTDANVTLTTSFAHLDPIHTVPLRFHIILENLISNAIKYRDPKKPSCEVHVETWDRDGVFSIAIRDNGIGIPEEYRSRIFAMFKRVARIDEPGSGLGLALARKNAEQLGGDIEADSSGDGSVFTLTLPRRQPEAEAGDEDHLLEVAK